MISSTSSLLAKGVRVDVAMSTSLGSSSSTPHICFCILSLIRSAVALASAAVFSRLVIFSRSLWSVSPAELAADAKLGLAAAAELELAAAAELLSGSTYCQSCFLSSSPSFAQDFGYGGGGGAGG